MARLESIKNLFLLGQSDYLTHFLDLATGELMRPAAQVSAAKLRSLLELVIRSPSSVSSSDPYKDTLTVEMKQTSLLDELMKINSMVGIDLQKHRENISAGRAFKVSESLAAPAEAVNHDAPMHLLGVDAFSLGYTIVFPLSLVLSKKVIQ